MKPIYFLLKHAYRRGFIYSLLLSFALFLVMIGCSTDTLDENIMETLTRSEADFNGSKTIASDTGRIVLGAVEPDVYTVEAMRAAYNQLYPTAGRSTVRMLYGRRTFTYVFVLKTTKSTSL